MIAMTQQNSLHFIGYATSIAGPNQESGIGPIVLKESPYISALSKQGLALHWEGIITPPKKEHTTTLEAVKAQCLDLGNKVSSLVKKEQFFMVLGGDHSSAIGTWSGARAQLATNEQMGLIWIDAHMDSHTPHTTLTGNIHGMPLACLLGYGDLSLTTIMGPAPVFLPENICLIGIRSFEEAEARLLEKLNVRIFYMDEINKRGLDAVMQEALSIVTRHTSVWGLSLDIDSIDPKDAPATDVSEPFGIGGADLCQALRLIAKHPNFIGAEIVEFDPHRDIEHKTEKLIADLIQSLTIG
jgi:arginase